MNSGDKLNMKRSAFTLIELLIAIAIIGLLISILIPALSSARKMAKSAICMTRLRTAGQGLQLYANENRDALVPARMPKIDSERWRNRVVGGIKYRPTFLTMMDSQVGIPPFAEPLPSADMVDSEGQPGDRQNYVSEQYVCPETPDWVDERNGSYGYNYHFLGNARLLDDSDLTSYKNWSVLSSQVRSPASCVAVADNEGTAATFPVYQRGGYEDNAFGDSKTGRTIQARGNEGFNLDPPRIDRDRGEMASNKSTQARTAPHERHRGRTNVLWVDGHASSETLESLGYLQDEDGAVRFDGDNRKFNIYGEDEAWVLPRNFAFD